MANEQNLRPFSSTYQPKNKNGRKKGSHGVKYYLNKILNEKIELKDVLGDDKITDNIKRKVIEVGLREQAKRWIEGDNLAGKDLLDRFYGKATENRKIKLDLQGKVAKKIQELFF